MRTAFSLLAAVLLSSCIVAIDHHDDDDETIHGSGVAGHETRSLAHFHGVTFAAIGDLTIVTGDAESIRIEADDNLIPYFETSVRAGTLHIEIEEDVRLRPERPVRLYLTVREIEALAVVGAGDADLDEASGEAFTVSLVGSGDVRIDDVDVASLDVSLVGTGDLEVAGEATELAASLSGIGNLDAPGLSTETASITVLGSGSATLRVRDRLDVTIAGSGSVRYYGNPSVEATVAGSGRVVKLGD
jgi:hypothetical protein